MHQDQAVQAFHAGVIGTKAFFTSEVYDCDMKRHGHIKDVILDARNGSILSAVVAYGGFLGVGEHQVIVPWEALGLGAGSPPPMPTRPGVAGECLKITLGPDRYKWLDVREESWEAEFRAARETAQLHLPPPGKSAEDAAGGGA